MTKAHYTTVDVNLQDFMVENLDAFKPHAFCTGKSIKQIKVIIEDCSYRGELVAPSNLVEVYWANHTTEKRCVGFGFPLLKKFIRLTGEVSVADCLRELEKGALNILGEHRDLLYRTCGDLKVRLP
jgi:hypothetical protein